MSRARWILLPCLLAICAGCASHAPDYRGKWRPLNRLADEPQEIPLRTAYVFAASPRDSTLRGLLGRWVRDNRMTLSYLSNSDFTLYEPVGQIQTTDLGEALRQLSDAYSAQGIQLSVEAGQVVVRSPSNGATGQ